MLCSKEDKNFFLRGGESTGIKLLVGKRISNFLASGWRLSSILLVMKTLQILPNWSQNFKTLYVMIHYADLFLTKTF